MPPFCKTGQEMKKKSSLKKRILKTLLIIIGTPILLFWLLVILLYIPPIQRWATNLVCEEVAESTGYDIEIGSVHLAFPLKLKITDFDMSKNGDSYINGEKLDVNVSLWPLFVGDVELNYVALEHLNLNTKEMMPEMAISGDVGYFRTVARNIELTNEIANLRQVHLYGANLNIELKDTVVVEEEEDEESSKWIINLHKAKIENSAISISMPGDSIKAKAEIGTMRLRKGYVNLDKEIYSVGKIRLEQGKITYDKGYLSKEEAPLDHICLQDVSLVIDNVKYSPDYTEATLTDFAFLQPGGIQVTETSATLALQPTQLDIKDFHMRSANGSYIRLKTSIPWFALMGLGQQQLDVMLQAGLNKKDLAGLLTKEQYGLLEAFDDKLFDASISARGNVGHMVIDTMRIDMPSLATLGLSGEAGNLLDMEKLEASVMIDGASDNLQRIMQLAGDTIETNASADINAVASYNRGRIETRMSLNGIGASIDGNAMFDMNDTTYNADIKINGLDLTELYPSVPLTHLSMNLKADGHGFDLFDKETRYDVTLDIDSVKYDKYHFKDLSLLARQKAGKSDIILQTDDNNLKLRLDAKTGLRPSGIRNRTSLVVEKADLKELGIMDVPFDTEMNLDVKFSTDMDKTHKLKFEGKEIVLNTQIKRFTPKDIFIDFATSPDTTYLTARNGDLIIGGNMKCGYTELFKAIDDLKNMFIDATKNHEMIHFLHDYENLLPQMNFSLDCGTDNMLANVLAIKQMRANSIKANLAIGSKKGLNISAGVYGFRTEGLNLDTVRMFTRQEGNRLRYLAGIRSTSVDEMSQKNTYSALLYGYMANDSLTANAVYRDSKDDLILKTGIVSTMKPTELDISFVPEAIFLGKPFFFNKENYIKVGKDIEADVTLQDGNNSGIHIYTTQDPQYEYNANVELFNIDLKEITSSLPYDIDISGIVNADILLKYGKENGLLVSSDIMADDIAYEGERIGNEIIELVYFPRGDDRHYLDALLLHNDEEVLQINGNFVDNDSVQALKGTATLTRFPLAITKAFTKNSGIEVDGYLDGDLTLNGPFKAMESNGSVSFDSVYIHAYDFGTSLHMADETVNIKDNKVLFDDFDIYANGDNPFQINGDIDISNLFVPKLNLAMDAKNYQLINTPRRENSMLYGKLLLDIKARISGTLNSMRMFGNIKMLNKSNITYVMLDAPIESDKELDGLVEFVNFNDTVKTTPQLDQEISFGNTNINIDFAIEDGARINADLDEARNNYVTTQGAGNLQIKYNNQNGLTVGGRYSMSGGEFKVTLPIIPLKTLEIGDGSEITWSGEVFNPDLNITAFERVTSSVTLDDNNMVPVPFDVGVKVTNTLEKMNLSFIMSSPENTTIQNELNALSPEDMNRYAVTMLITGSYAGNKNITAANALSSFIDAKINDIAGTAMKGVNVNMGINDATNAETGSTYKNYSFSFSKRFWNDRMTIVIGGEVNSGDRPRGSNGFINNASLEWKVNNAGNRFLRVFYDKNYESILEGEITETGAGYIYKRKLDNLKDLFIFRKKKEEEKKDGKEKEEKAPEQSKED